MSKVGFRCRIHDLKHFEVGFFFIFLDFATNMKAPSQKFVGKKFNLMQFIMF